jgi:DNA uptake protein ComE-like DNA-binding protein
MHVRFGLRLRLLAVVMMFGVVVSGLFARTLAAQKAAAPQQTVAQKIAASEDLLDINTASAVQLKALPGMGDAYAQRVIAGRPYTAKNQLTMRGILPAGEYEQIKPLIIAHRVKR